MEGPYPSKFATYSLNLLTLIGAEAQTWGVLIIRNVHLTEKVMRDTGLEEAIRVAGGVGALARKIGISQPSVSNWARVPAERVLAVEAATGIDRSVLRPDLYNEGNPGGGDLDDVDTARAQEYTLLAMLLAHAPDQALLDRLALLRSDPTPLGVAHAALADAASRVNAETVEREYFNLFIGLGRGELLPYGSYYLSGFLHERPLARLRADLRQLGIERAEGENEPEDHAAILCEIMAGLINGRLPAKPGADDELFDKHLSPWIGRFFSDLEQAEAADFYRKVGALGRLFVDIETEAFALPS
jgi:TorA maturation chaperone TorD